LQFDLSIKTNHRPPREIFDEGQKLHPNSVNDCFPDRRNGLRQAPGRAGRTFLPDRMRYSTKGRNWANAGA
jgi:hypothetical protein